MNAPEGKARGDQDDEAYHRRNENPPVAPLSLETRFAKLGDEDNGFVRPASRRNIAHQLGQSIFRRRSSSWNLRKTGHAESPPRQERRSTLSAPLLGTS